MPELPEVETVRRDISGLFVGGTLERIVVTGRRTVRRHAPGLLAPLEGQVLAGVGRHGKYLLFEFAGGQVLVVHLRMSGQLLAVPAAGPTALHTHAVMAFAGAGELRFVDPRTFGEMFVAGHQAGGGAAGPSGAGRAVASPASPGLPAELRHLGPDALEVEPAGLAAKLAGRRAPLKSLLVDQRVLAGIGNIYADEICFDAGLRPERAAGSLRRADVRRLVGSARSVLSAAIEARGSTLSDQQYRDLLGEAGRFQLQHKVYGRAGLACRACGQEIQRVRFGAKSAFACPTCQP